MEDWFAKTSAAERDAMSALQLDYQFQGDNLGSVWWLHLQSLGFKHNGVTYNLPDSAPLNCKERSYTGAELYREMDRFAIPQLTSPFQEFPSCPPRPEHLTREQREAIEWWQRIRDEMIFQRFRTDVEGFQLKDLPPAKSATLEPLPTPSTTTPSSITKRRRSTGQDAGAELVMRKFKKGNSKGKDRDYTSNVKFPTIREYARHVSTEMNMNDIEKREPSLASSFFDEWKYQTVMNHSLLLFGIGSKRTLLNHFADLMESQGESVIVVDGFHKDVTIEGILDLICKCWLRGHKLDYDKNDIHLGKLLHIRSYGYHNFPSQGDITTIQRACSISQALADRTSECKHAYYLILHNIDGVGLRNSTAQASLAALVAHSSTLRGLNAFRLVASVDHINGPALLWDTLTTAQFRWIWKPVHTHRPYVEELTQSTHADERLSKVVLRKQQDAEASTEHKAIFTVLESLAPRHAEALQELAGLQAKQIAESRKQTKGTDSSVSSSWVEHKSLLKQCQQKCVVHADEQLRRFLQELKDHGVVEQSNTGVTNALSYRIPHAAKTLKNILDFNHTR